MGPLTHHPGDEISTITPKVYDRSTSVLNRIRKPVKEVGTNANFFWAGMTIVHHDFSDRSNSIFRMHQFVSFMIATIPRGFIVGKQLNFILLCQGFHLLSMIEPIG